jgi:glycosyltransferase involved in cell wall biosynthesis
MRVSVCMATYNGERYIEAQFFSIVEQISEQDEIVVVDDCSSDGTFVFLSGLRDPRVKIFRNEKNVGVNYSFQRAISLCSGRYIFLSDQDDVWVGGRLDLMLAALQENILVSSNFALINSIGSSIENSFYRPLISRESGDNVRNIIGIFLGRRNYFGCAMAFQRSLVQLVMPIPDYVESHDLWIAMAGCAIGSISHIEQETLKRRIHGENASVISRPLWAKIIARVSFIRQFFELQRRLKYFRER